MHSESRMDESDYLFLHLMDGNDAQVHDPVTCFQIKVEVACDQRDDDENSFGGSIEKPIPPDSYKAHSTYFSWNEKIRLKLGPTTEKSTLVVTLLKNDVDSITGNDTCDALGTPVRQLVYAKTRIFLRKLLSGQSAQRDHESDSSDQESSQHGFKRHDRMLYLKILSKKITPGLCNISKGTSNTDRVNTRPLSPDSKIRAAENAYSVALNELSATLVGPITAEKPSTRANSREHVSAELGSCNSGFDQGVSPLFFRLRLGYMLVPASGISMGLRSDTRMRAGLTVMDTVSSNEDAHSANHPPLSRHGDISEITRFFFSGGPSASRRPSELSTYGTRDYMLNDAIGNVEDGFILTEHAYVSRSSSRSGGRRGVQEITVRKSSVNAIGNRATSSIFEELHNMCCQSSFPATSRWAKKGDTTRSEPTDSEQLDRNVGPKSTEKFLDCEFEMPSRTFIEFLRLRVSPLWAEMVQKVVDELSRTAGVDRGTRIADAGAGLLGASTTSIPDQIDTNMDLGSVRDSTRGDKAPSGMSGISPDILRVLDLLRAGARVRVVERKTPGMPSTQPSTGAGVRAARGVAIVRFTESSAIRFLVAAMDSQGGVDAGGQKAVVSQALQAVLEQSDTRNLIDQISDIESLFRDSQLEEIALCEILNVKKPVEIVNVKSVNSVSEKVLEHDFYRSMSDLAGIRTLVMSSGSPVRRKDKDMRIEITAMKRHALLLALSQISDMKASCVAASDAVFRSLTEAQEEGGHALVSARARSLLLPAQHMGSKRSVRKGRSPRYARCGIEISQGSYSDLLLLGKELRVVEKVVKQSLRALGGYGDITSQRDVVDDTTDPFKEDLENFPHSPQTNSVQSRENQQWQDSSTSRAPARTPPTAKGSIPVPSHEIRILDPAPEHTSTPLDRNPSLEEDTKEGEAVSALHVPPPRADSARILEAKEITIPCDQGLTEVKEETRRPEVSVTPSASEGADNEQSIGR